MMRRRDMTAMLLGAAMIAGVLGLTLVAAPAPGVPPVPPAATHPGAGAADARPGAVNVARLICAGVKEEVCFADGFLTNVDRSTDTKVRRRFAFVELASEDLFNYPFVVMTGEKAFKLSDAEKKNLKAYIDRGGFVLASASCSSAEWADSFRPMLAALYPDRKLAALPLDHPVFHRLYDIDRIVTRKEAGQPVIYGLEWGGRLRVVFSPFGLNDTANAGGGCCCCGGNEIRNAQLICADVLVYALTQ